MKDAAQWVILIVILLVLTGFISPVRIKFLYLRKDKEKFYRLHFIWLWNILSLPVPPTLLRLFKRKGRYSRGREEQKFFSLKDINLLLRYLRRRVSRFKKLGLKFARNSRWRKMTLSLYFGMNDSADTGIVSGILWMLAGTVLAFLQQNFVFVQATRPAVNIYPDFKGSGFQLVIDLDVEYRQTFRLIILGLYLIRIIIPTGGELRKWRTIRFRG